jgi:hypothetical protein
MGCGSYSQGVHNINSVLKNPIEFDFLSRLLNRFKYFEKALRMNSTYKPFR